MPAAPGTGSYVGRFARALLESPWVTRDEARAAFDRLEAAEPIGSRVHGALAGLGGALLLGPTSIAQFAFVSVLVMFAIRAHRAWPTWVHWFGQTPWLVAMGWAGWMALSLLWSTDPRHGLAELADMRWAVLGVLVWPAIRRRRWIIVGFAAGYLCGHGSQLFQGIQEAMGVEHPFWDRDRRRLSGWWDPAVGGSLLTAAVGLHAGVAFLGKGRARAIAVVGLLLALVGVFATGTRSGWLASAALLAGVAVYAGVRAASRTTPRRALVGVVIGTVLLGGAGATAWALAGDEIRLRALETRDEFDKALAGDLDTATGYRVLMNKWAVQAWLRHPVRGVGAGGFKDWANGRAWYAFARGTGPALDYDDPKYDDPAHAHAHNALLHLAATQGTVGVGFAAVIVACALRGAFVGVRPGSYDAAPGFMLIGLLLVSAFDTIQHNAQTAALFWVIVGLCPPWRPRFGEDPGEVGAGR